AATRAGELPASRPRADRHSTTDDPPEVPPYYRQCQPNQMDMFCRDRFRLELTKTSLTLYVNGRLYLQDSGWPAAYQIPDAWINGGDNTYVYFTDWPGPPTPPPHPFPPGRASPPTPPTPPAPPSPPPPPPPSPPQGPKPPAPRPPWPPPPPPPPIAARPCLPRPPRKCRARLPSLQPPRRPRLPKRPRPP